MADKKINIVFETSGLEETQKGLNQTAQSAENASKKIADSMRNSSSEGSKFSASMIANFGSMVVGIGAVSSAIIFMRDSIKKAAEEETAITKLNNVLKVSGSYSKQASQDLVNFADGIEKTSVYSNELVLNQIALAKTFGYSNAEAKYLIVTGTKLAATLGIDLASATEILQGTMAGVLPKSIKNLSAELKNMSPEALKAGDFFRWVNKNGLDASSSLETYEGKVHQLTVSYDDLQKSFGKAVIENPNLLSAITNSGKALQVFADNIKNNEGTFGKFVNETLTTMAHGFEGILKAVTSTNIELQEQKINKLTESIAALKRQAESGSNTSFWQDVFGMEGDKLTNAERNSISKKIQEAEAERSKLMTELAASRKKGSDNNNVEEAIKKGTMSDEDRNTIKSSKFSNEMYDQQLQLERDYSDKLKQINDETNANSLESTQNAQMQQLEAEMLYNQQMMDIKLANDQEQAFLIENKYTREKTMLENANKYLMEQEKLKTKYIKDTDKLRQDQTKQSEESRKQILTSSLGQVAGLMSNSNQELFRIGQAASIAQATISTLTGATKALELGPILGPVMAAAIYAAGIANVAQIASTKPPKYETGGIFDPTGASVSGDSGMARLNSREMILNMQQQANLLNIATNGGGLSSNLLIDIKDAIIAQNYSVDIDGERLNNRLKDINSRRLK